MIKHWWFYTAFFNTANSIGDNLAIYAAVLAILFNNQSYSKLL